MNPIIEVTLENGKTKRFTKKFKYEKIIDDNETKFQLQLQVQLLLVQKLTDLTLNHTN
jgi:hypothetical protein